MCFVMENQFESSKKGKGTMVVIIALVLLVLGLSGYIVYDKMLTKESTETKEPAKAEKVEAPNEDLNEIANSLFEKTENYKLYILGNFANSNNLTVTNQMNEAQIYALSMYFLLNNMTVTKAGVDSYMKELYNIQLSNYPDIPLCGAKFDTSKNEYVISEFAHDAMENKPLISKVASIEKNNNNYVLTVTRLYQPSQGVSYSTPENAFYTDAQFTTKIDELNQFTKTDSLGNWDKADVEGAKNYYEQNYEQFKNLKPQYKYTFAKDNNNYYLVSYELVK